MLCYPILYNQTLRWSTCKVLRPKILTLVNIVINRLFSVRYFFASVAKFHFCLTGSKYIAKEDKQIMFRKYRIITMIGDVEKFSTYMELRKWFLYLFIYLFICLCIFSLFVYLLLVCLLLLLYFEYFCSRNIID